MAVKIRLTRMGANKAPFYRIVVADSKVSRDGKCIDVVGHYNPTTNPVDLVVDVEKAKKWVTNGAQPTETVKSLLVQAGAMEKTTKLSAPKTNPKGKKK